MPLHGCHQSSIMSCFSKDMMPCVRLSQFSKAPRSSRITGAAPGNRCSCTREASTTKRKWPSYLSELREQLPILERSDFIEGPNRDRFHCRGEGPHIAIAALAAFNPSHDLGKHRDTRSYTYSSRSMFPKLIWDASPSIHMVAQYSRIEQYSL